MLFVLNFTFLQPPISSLPKYCTGNIFPLSWGGVWGMFPVQYPATPAKLAKCPKTFKCLDYLHACK